MRNKVSSERALFLVDGSNFYHSLQGAGISKGDLDFKKLSIEIAKGRQIIAIEFFSAPVQPPGTEEAKAQQRFFSNLRKNGVRVKLGRLAPRSRTCPRCKFREQYRLEKGVDVGIAISLVIGAVENTFDVVYLLTNDSDFAPAVDFARKSGKKVFQVAPKGSKHEALGKSCDTTIFVDQSVVNLCQAF